MKDLNLLNETILLPMVVISMIMILLSPMLIRMIKKTIKNAKKIKRLDQIIGQKKRDRQLIDTYDSHSRHLGQFVEGMACQELTEDQKEWKDKTAQYLNENIKEYLDAKERLYGDNYVLTF